MLVRKASRRDQKHLSSSCASIIQRNTRRPRLPRIAPLKACSPPQAASQQANQASQPASRGQPVPGGVWGGEPLGPLPTAVYTAVYGWRHGWPRLATAAHGCVHSVRSCPS